MKNKNFTIIISIAIVVLIALLAGIYLVFTKNSSEVAPDNTLQKLKTSSKLTPKNEAEEKTSKSTEILDELKEKSTENPDMVGWISLPNSRVDYPVMYTPHDRDFYLRRNFFKQQDIYGLPYIDTNCSLDGDNFLIYGHETDNGTQFHDFLQYSDKNFWENNKYFEYSTLYDKYKYEVVAFCKSQVFDRDQDVFKYYQFYGSDNEEDFNNYINNIKQIQLYDTGITPKYGDHLITLSMCASPYHTQTEADYRRFVLVARRVDDGE